MGHNSKSVIFNISKYFGKEYRVSHTQNNGLNDMRYASITFSFNGTDEIQDQLLKRSKNGKEFVNIFEKNVNDIRTPFISYLL